MAYITLAPEHTHSNFALLAHEVDQDLYFIQDIIKNYGKSIKLIIKIIENFLNKCLKTLLFIRENKRNLQFLVIRLFLISIAQHSSKSKYNTTRKHYQ